MKLSAATATRLPAELEPRRLLRRALQVLALVGVLVLALLLAPGLDEVTDELGGARPGWIAAAAILELLSCLSYILLFRPVFCSRMSWRLSSRISWAELGVGSLVPASGAAGLALGAWALHASGMPADRIARRSVAFFLVKSSVNFAAVAVLGALMAVGLFGDDQPLWLTAGPAALAVLTIVAVLLIPRLGPGREPARDAGRLPRALLAARRAIVDGVAEAVELLRRRDTLVLAGAIGYWAFDNAVLWATFHAFGASVPITTILMGYLIGQLGGLLPIPGGVGGIDGGLIGALVVFGAPAVPAAAAVLAYRTILFWLPLAGGAIAFVALRRELASAERGRLAAC
ncbi:MAG TPA: flippase-like domain-containing protein [Capillimicrobium sp.]|nr:flippase-like domain-containing protein [Capillimicrobium sp.]